MMTEFKTWFVKQVPKFLLWFAPILRWFDHTFTIPFSMKLITEDHVDVWEKRFVKGTVFVTDIYGQGSNILNPSDGKHGAIYFGKGIKTHIEMLMLNEPEKITENFKKYWEKRKETASDDKQYVIESIGEGVVITSITKFLTRKDVVRAFIPKFCKADGMSRACDHSVYLIGKPYDYKFSDDNDAEYCFEVAIDAYQAEFPSVKFKQESYFGYMVYLASAFKDEENWTKIIDSKVEYPELYKKH